MLTQHEQVKIISLDSGGLVDELLHNTYANSSTSLFIPTLPLSKHELALNVKMGISETQTGSKVISLQ